MIDFANLAAGHRLTDRYTVERLIGRGRSSAVYRAIDESAGTPVALKVLDPFLSQEEVSVERFRREVQIVRSLEHPNIIEVLDFLHVGGLYVICMELVEGDDLKTHLQRRGPLKLEEFLRLAPLVLSAVSTCHREGVLHRDIKPQNLLLDAHGEVRLADFGISKINTMSDLTKTGSVIGTPEYMAPELFRSGRADPRSEIYALGAVFYELLAGVPPLAGTSLTSVMTQQLDSAVEPLSLHRPDVPDWLDAVILRCLALDPDQRYQSPDEVETELRRAERALAVYQHRSRPARCLACGEEMVPGLVFCQDCGKFTREVFEPGPFHVILYRADEPGLLRDCLDRLYPGIPRWRSRIRLQLTPSVLFSGLSRGAADSLYNELAASFCELGVSERLPAEMRMPGWMTGLALLLVPAFVFLIYYGLVQLGYGDIRGGPLLQVMIVGAPVASIATLLALYRWKIRPLVSFRRARRHAHDKPSEAALRLVKLLRAVHSRSTRRLLGTLAASYFAIRNHAEQSGGIDPDAVEALVVASFRAARQLDLYEAHLSGRSLMGIKEQLDRVAARIPRTSDERELEALVKSKSDLAQELADYRETEERHSRTHLAVLAAGGTLEKIRNALQGGEHRPDLDAELAALTADLAESPTG